MVEESVSTNYSEESVSTNYTEESVSINYSDNCKICNFFENIIEWKFGYIKWRKLNMDRQNEE